MKTTLDLPDDLMREIEVRATREGRKLNDLIVELLRRGMVAATVQPRRVQLPLIRSGHPAKPGEELTPERVAEILLAEEVERAIGR